MPRTLFGTWGKAAETLGKAIGQSAGERPQAAHTDPDKLPAAVHKPPIVPTLYPTFAHSFPQQKMIKIPPLRSLFPTQSTEPITTSTNL